MKILFLASLFLGQSLQAELIGTAPLDPGQPLSVEVGQSTPTVLQFPAPVEAIIGTELVEGEEGGSFQFHHLETSNLITLRALQPDARTMLTVSLEGRLYLFHLHTGDHPRSILKLTRNGIGPDRENSVLTRRDVLSMRPVYHSEKYRNLINLARNPDLLAGIAPNRVRAARMREGEFSFRQNGITTVIERIVQFPGDDALVFFGVVENRPQERTGKESFLIRIATKTFPLNYLQWGTTSETSTTVSFAAVLVGDGKGKRTHFSLDNPFRLVPAVFQTP